MKSRVKAALDILLSMVIGLWIGVLIADMLLPMVLRLCDINGVAIEVVRIVGYILIVPIVLYKRTHRATHKSTLTYKIREFKPVDILTPIGISLALHIILCFVFKFAMYMAGAGHHLAQLIFTVNNPDITIITGYEVPTSLYAVCTLATYIFYTVAVFLSYKSGFDKGKIILKEHEENRK